MAVKKTKKAKAEPVKEVKSQLIQHSEQVVRQEPKDSFDERTSSTPPWQNEDGSQNNG